VEVRVEVGRNGQDDAVKDEQAQHLSAEQGVEQTPLLRVHEFVDESLYHSFLLRGR
jgi:hypothetical protein